MIRHSYIQILIFALITMSACKSDQKSQADSNNNKNTEEVVQNESLPKDFEDFYNKFQSDTIFQLERTLFPLKGTKVVSDLGKIEEYTYQKDEWVVHRPYDDMNGTFQRSFSTMPSVVEERIVTTQANFSMLRRYGKLSGEWHLIYYKPMAMY